MGRSIARVARPRVRFVTARTAVAALALGTVSVLLPAGSATADPSAAEMSRRAAVLRVELDRLGVAQDLAVERFDAAREALRQATTDEVLSTYSLTDVRRAAADTRARSSQRARAIYMSGGSLGLTASVLDSTSIGDALTRWKAVEAVVEDARQVQQDTDDRVRRQQGVALSAARLRARTVARQAEAAAAVDAVRTALTEQRDLLARTDARVVALAQREQAEAEARAAAAAAQTARLGLGSGTAGTASASAPTARTVRPADGRGLEGATAADQALPDVPAPTSLAATAIAAGRTRLGMPYVWGATGPSSFDCSGLTQWAYRRAGVSIPRTSREQYAGLPKVPLSQLAPGDLFFYATDVHDPSTIHHVGMYLGAGLSLYAPRTGSNVKIGPVGYGRILGAVRPSAAQG
jgi:cell wall-associated NlpC family hydrolase